MVATIGVLALQGDFHRHQEMLTSLGCEVRIVRYPGELHGLDGLVLPGGESTTISKQLDRNHLRRPLLEFAHKRPVMGTCAGLILMAREPSDPRVAGLNLMDLVVARNSWGRQIHSFTTLLEVRLNGQMDMIPAVFIRAPRIRAIGPEVEVLAQLESEPVLVRQGRHLAATFHPELTPDTRIHAEFLKALAE